MVRPVWYPVSAHQEAVRVNPVWRAGDEGRLVFAMVECEFAQIVRQHDIDLVDLVGVRLPQHMEGERVAGAQLVEVAEQCRGR